MVDRRQILLAGPFGLLSAAVPGSVAAQGDPQSQDSPSGLLFPSQSPELVQEMVGVAHSKLERVRALLAEHPALANAAWDWGFGDWETALGAASHTGQREIAALLIATGARPDLFTFAMLGHLQVVRACVEAQPGIQRTHGPHGITLLKHARAGGAASAAVVAYLESLGDADIEQSAAPLPPAWADKYVGQYAYGARADERFVVQAGRSGGLTLRKGSTGTPRVLIHLGEHTFHPTGAAAVKIRFEVRAGAVAGLRISDGPQRHEAARIE